MGKLKLHGSRRKAITSELGLKKTTLEEIKQKFGLPDITKFLGYSVHLEESDEFLAKFDDLPEEGLTKKIWTKTPQMAHIYKKFTKAFEISMQCQGAIVVGMLDTEEQIIVVPVTENE